MRAPGDSSRSQRRARTAGEMDDLAHLLDEAFRIPGLGWRFGLDAVIGLIPGVGDVASGALGVFLISRAMRFGVPGVVVARMALNTLLDLTVGAIPIVGDLFDLLYRSNRRNMDLFRRYASDPGRSTRGEWASLLGLLLIVLGVLGLIVVGLGSLVGEIARTP